MRRGRVIISGATGFIGRPLVGSLLERDYEVMILSRQKAKGQGLFGGEVTVAEWDGRTSQGWIDLASGAFAIINLSGENIGVGRWTAEKRQRILESRVNAGKAVVEAVVAADPKPRVVIQASAVGFYGPRREEAVDESSPSGEGFLPRVAREWESSTQKLEELNVRRIIIRSGVILGRGGGALPRLLRPFYFYAGGSLGRGSQWFPWIHLSDETEAICFLLEREDLQGVFNLVSPHPVRNTELCISLGRALGRPCWLPVPGFLLRLFLGEKAKEMLLSGQKVLPQGLLKAGYEFLYPDLDEALREILGEER